VALMNVGVTSRLQFERIEEAARIIEPVFLNSPQFRAEQLDGLLDCRLVVKVEALHPIRLFKGRGACYLASRISEPP
jgi:threonine dehydratase